MNIFRSAVASVIGVLAICGLADYLEKRERRERAKKLGLKPMKKSSKEGFYRTGKKTRA